MRVILVEDTEEYSIHFRVLCKQISDIELVGTFANALDALKFLLEEQVDIVFLDLELPDMPGIELAQKILLIDAGIRIIFVTAFEEYALQAFEIGAVGYVTKPYVLEDLLREIRKARRFIRPSESSRVYIKTFGGFDVFVNEKPVFFSNAKAKEFLALLIDRRGTVTTKQAVESLWGDREYDANTGSLFRRAIKNLKETLAEYDISDILVDNRNNRYIDASKLRCDYYEILQHLNFSQWNGEYLTHYSWAEGTRTQLARMAEHSISENA